MIGYKNEQIKVVFGTGFIVKLERDFTLPVNFDFHIKKDQLQSKKLKVLESITKKLITLVF